MKGIVKDAPIIEAKLDFLGCSLESFCGISLNNCHQTNRLVSHFPFQVLNSEFVKCKLFESVSL